MDGSLLSQLPVVDNLECDEPEDQPQQEHAAGQSLPEPQQQQELQQQHAAAPEQAHEQLLQEHLDQQPPQQPQELPQPQEQQPEQQLELQQQEQQAPAPPAFAGNGDALPPPPAADAAAGADQQQQQQQEQQPQEGTKRRRHKWGPPAAGEFADEEKKPKKRRSRWESSTELIVPTAKTGAIVIPGQLPKEVSICGGLRIVLANPGGLTHHSDPKVQRLHEQLNELNRKLAVNELDIPPEHERSPSPEPIYDASGIRLNTREIRAREKLLDKRNRVIEDVIKHDPEYRPPADYKPRKFSAKIYIPVNEYPGYNFIGLIIGPRGNTQKRMQRETNCKIAIRGRGSVKEGISKDPKYDYGEDEELHVLITGENQEDVDRATAMVEKLCTPSDDEHNEHKRLQLRELAALNGTLKDITACFICGDDGHDAEHCPKKALEVYKLPDQMLSKVQEQYERDVARVHGGPVVSMDAEYRSFLAELGGAPPPELMGLDPMGNPLKSQLPDECKLYVGNLPNAYDSAMLRQLFEPHAKLMHSAVITEPGSGMSRGFGFVHIPDPEKAKQVRDMMDGTLVDGRALVVRLRSERGQGGGGGGPPRPSFGGGFGDGPHSHHGPRPGEIDEAKLYVAGLTQGVTEHALRDLFGKYGEVREIRIITDRDTNQCKGFAFIGFVSKEAAAAAMNGLDGYKLESKALVVRIAGQKDPPRRRGPEGPHHMMYPGGPPMPPGMYPPGPGYGPPPPYGHPYGGPPPYGAPYGDYGHGYGGYGHPPPYGAPPGAYGAPPPYGGQQQHYGGPPPYGADPYAGYGGAQQGGPASGYGEYGAEYSGYPPQAMGVGAAPPPLPPGPPPLPPGPPPMPPGADAAAAGADAAAAGGGYGGAPQQQMQQQQVQQQQQPPPAPPAPGGGSAQTEYERFMQDLQRMNG